MPIFVSIYATLQLAGYRPTCQYNTYITSNSGMDWIGLDWIDDWIGLESIERLTNSIGIICFVACSRSHTH